MESNHNISTTSTSSTSTNDDIIKGSIAAIANRIQEKANQLSEERTMLQSLENELVQTKQELEYQQSEHDTNRERLLTQTRTLHGYELEILNYQRMIHKLHAKIDSNEEIKRKREVEIEMIRKECDKMNSSIFVPHLFKTCIYKRKLECKVQSLKAKRRRREETLDRMRSETDRNREENVSMEREVRRLKDEIKMLEDVEMREDEEIAAVAMQIRATLAKRVSLRSALQEAHERNREANDDMLKWEAECMKLSNHNSNKSM